jgi:hypothetical protein
VSVRTFVIPFYNGSGSATEKSYGSYATGSATLLICLLLKPIATCEVVEHVLMNDGQLAHNLLALQIVPATFQTSAIEAATR